MQKENEQLFRIIKIINSENARKWHMYLMKSSFK
jgi:hypothetical protein